MCEYIRSLARNSHIRAMNVSPVAGTEPPFGNMYHPANGIAVRCKDLQRYARLEHAAMSSGTCSLPIDLHNDKDSNGVTKTLCKLYVPGKIAMDSCLLRSTTRVCSRMTRSIVKDMELMPLH